MVEKELMTGHLSPGVVFAALYLVTEEIISITPTASKEADLIDILLSGYNPLVRPTRNVSKSVLIDTKFSLSRLDGLDLRNQLLTTTGWLTLYYSVMYCILAYYMSQVWKDDFLQWNPANFSDLTKIVIPVNKIWHPEVAIDNSVGDIFSSTFSALFMASIYNDGTVVWEPGGPFSTTCDIKIATYPFDGQSCGILFANWQYTIDQVNLTSTETKIGMDSFSDNGEWNIKYTTISVENWMSADAPDEIYPEVKMTIHMERRFNYYIVNILYPCLMMSLLVLMVFHLPPDSGEKVSLGVTVLLAFSVFQLMIAENVPTSSEATPILEIYLLFFMTESTFSVAISVFVLNLHHRTEYKTPPRWLKVLVLEWMATLLMMKKCSNTKVHPEHSPSTESHSSKSYPDDHKVSEKFTHSFSLDNTFSPPNIVIDNVNSTDDNDDAKNLQPDHTFIRKPSLASNFSRHGDLGVAPSDRGTSLKVEKSMMHLMKSFTRLEAQPSVRNRCEMIKILEQTYHELCQQRQDDEMEAILENEWKNIANVVDRFFFVITFICIVISSIVIFGFIPAMHKTT